MNASRIARLTLHNEEVGVIHIKLHRMEQVCHLASRSVSPVDQVFAFTAKENLSRHCYFRALLIANGTTRWILVIEDNCNNCLVDSSLSLLIDEFGEVSCTNLTQVRNAEYEANGIKNVRLAGSI